MFLFFDMFYMCLDRKIIRINPQLLPPILELFIIYLKLDADFQI